MRAASVLLVFLGLATAADLAVAQSTEEVKYYAATNENGDPMPAPDPWCTLSDFGGTSLWACPSLADWNAFVGQHSDGSGNRGSMGGGGMDGGGGGGMD
jgi:hypothetical protein